MNFNMGRGSSFVAPAKAWAAVGLVALIGSLAAGCKSECDAAADHIKECGYDDGDRNSDEACDGKIECASKCLQAAPCDALNGKDLAAEQKYLKCIQAC